MLKWHQGTHKLGTHLASLATPGEKEGMVSALLDSATWNRTCEDRKLRVGPTLCQAIWLWEGPWSSARPYPCYQVCRFGGDTGHSAMPALTDGVRTGQRTMPEPSGTCRGGEGRYNLSGLPEQYRPVSSYQGDSRSVVDLAL